MANATTAGPRWRLHHGGLARPLAGPGQVKVMRVRRKKELAIRRIVHTLAMSGDLGPGSWQIAEVQGIRDLDRRHQRQFPPVDATVDARCGVVLGPPTASRPRPDDTAELWRRSRSVESRCRTGPVSTR